MFPNIPQNAGPNGIPLRYTPGAGSSSGAFTVLDARHGEISDRDDGAAKSGPGNVDESLAEHRGNSTAEEVVWCWCGGGVVDVTWFGALRQPAKSVIGGQVI